MPQPLVELADRVVREPECFELSGYVEQHRKRLEAKREFPKRFKLNPKGGKYGAVGWSYRELMEWLAKRRASRG